MTFESYVLLTLLVAPVVLVNAYVLIRLAVVMMSE
jgi:hypothetical protein|nr:MAG TPA: hypothetical protein [Myoviridae sp. ctqgO2]DAR82415.1 MAG TPA: hypothetical protein [Caudoviricetes sp.]